MERIEVPATVYWKSKTGKTFTSQEDCEKWERFYDKWLAPVRYREFENVDGTPCFVHWTETKEDLEELIWFARHRHTQATHNYVRVGDQYQPQWVILSPEYDEYGAELAIKSIDDFREELDEIFKAARAANDTVVKLIWEKA